MAKYGDTAIKAVELFTGGKARTPREAWEMASIQVFGIGTPSQKKGCPRNAFLGLCEDGLVLGIPPGRYTQSYDNKQYAIKAIAKIKECISIIYNKQVLWNAIAGNKCHNNQMDVVISLWNRKYIK